jgi:hypothetical protein
MDISAEMYPELVDTINSNNHATFFESVISAKLDGNNDIICCTLWENKQYTVIIEDESDAVKIVGPGCT